MSRSYSKLIRLSTFDDRFNYLKLNGVVGHKTFGFERYLNQELYRSRIWKDIRNKVILRDEACDLGMIDRPIGYRVLIHHINPISIVDIEEGNECVFDLDNLISTSLDTHNALHYGDISLINLTPITRTKGDTCPWKVY